MTRIMGDATHVNVGSLPRSIQLAGLYNTGTPDIKATPGDIAYFTSRGIPVVLIDQAYEDSPSAEAHAFVFDVETNAFFPSDAARIIGNCQQDRPTIYVNRSNLMATIISAHQAPNWKGDIWLAFPGWTPGIPLPAIPDYCRYVAIQDVSTATHDLSTVLDPTWPEASMIPDKPDDVLQTLNMWSNPDGSLAWLYVATDGYAYTRFDPGAKGWGPAVRVS